MAHSNPCFEVWLLLHVTELDPNDQFGRCEQVITRLREVLGAYNKHNLDLQRFPLDSVRLAAERAEKLDKYPSDRWPRQTGSHLYHLVGKLFPNRDDLH